MGVKKLFGSQFWDRETPSQSLKRSRLPSRNSHPKKKQNPDLPLFLDHPCSPFEGQWLLYYQPKQCTIQGISRRFPIHLLVWSLQNGSHLIIPEGSLQKKQQHQHPGLALDLQNKTLRFGSVPHLQIRLQIHNSGVRNDWENEEQQQQQQQQQC